MCVISLKPNCFAPSMRFGNVWSGKGLGRFLTLNGRWGRKKRIKMSSHPPSRPILILARSYSLGFVVLCLAWVGRRKTTSYRWPNWICENSFFFFFIIEFHPIRSTIRNTTKNNTPIMAVYMVLKYALRSICQQWHLVKPSKHHRNNVMVIW